LGRQEGEAAEVVAEEVEEEVLLLLELELERQTWMSRTEFA
jgi:hypothetical protein